MWSRCRVLLLLFLGAGASFPMTGGTPGPQESKPAATASSVVRRLPDVNDLIALALLDARTLSPQDRAFTRYVSDFERTGSFRTTSLVLNYDSRSSRIRRPMVLHGGLLVRVDLRHYAPRVEDVTEWVALWEQMAFDPRHSLLVTRDNLDLLKDLLRGQPDVFLSTQKRVKLVPRPDREITLPNGEKIIMPRKALRVETDEEEFVFPDDKTVAAVRLNGHHLDRTQYDELQHLLSTQAPVIDHRYLKHRLINTVKDKLLYPVVWGGLYYEFNGVRKAQDVFGKDTKVKDFDLMLESLGIGNIKAGVGYDKLFDKLRSDRRALVRSRVTGKWRVVEAFNTPSADAFGTAFGAFTDDIADGDVDLLDRYHRNLLRPRVKAREGIFQKANGLLVFFMVDGQGNLQNEVPFDIAHDTTIPPPNTMRLQTRGCVLCHAITGQDGWMPFRNIVPDYVRRGGMDLFDDRSQLVRFTPDVVDRLYGLYSGQFDKPLRRARDDLAEATLRCTGVWSESQDQMDVCRLAALRLKKELDDYWYGEVDAWQALREEGWDVPRERAVEIFANLHPPETRAVVGGIIPEDPSIGILRKGGSVYRADWALSFPFAHERSLRSPYRQKLQQEVKTP